MNILTADEKQKLEEQLKDLIRQRRAITDRIATARALGDLKENGDYHAAREDQGMNEAKIRQLESRLATAVVAGNADSVPQDMVFLGATVKLRQVDSAAEEMFKLVGEVSGSLDSDIVEVTPESPMGMALMKARVGEVVRVNSRRGERKYEIVEIM